MRSKFDEQLHLLNQEMMQMGSMIEDSIQKAINALIDQNVELAKKIMDKNSKKLKNRFRLMFHQICVETWTNLRNTVTSTATRMVGFGTWLKN